VWGQMKRLVLAQLVWVLLGLGLWCVQEVSAQNDFLAESERKAKEILQQAVEALGGYAYLRVEDMVRSGRTFQLRGDELKATGNVQIFEKFPSKTRQEIGSQDLVQINTGDKGWKIEYKNVKEQSPEELADFKVTQKHNLDHILRFRLNEEGMRFRYLGKSQLDLDQVEGVQLIDKSGDKVKIYVSVSTHLPSKMEFQTPGRGNRWTSDDERIFSNYHTVQGIQVPFSTFRYANGYKVSELQLVSVEINRQLDDSLFQPVLRKK
jgi:hypothetical protein